MDTGFKEIILTSEIALLAEKDYIAELKKKISNLEVKLSFMHGENYNIRRNHQEKVTEITKGYDEKIRAHKESVYTAEKKSKDLKSEINILTNKLGSYSFVIMNSHGLKEENI